MKKNMAFNPIELGLLCVRAIVVKLQITASALTTRAIFLWC